MRLQKLREVWCWSEVMSHGAEGRRESLVVHTGTPSPQTELFHTI